MGGNWSSPRSHPGYWHLALWRSSRQAVSSPTPFFTASEVLRPGGTAGHGVFLRDIRVRPLSLVRWAPAGTFRQTRLRSVCEVFPFASEPFFRGVGHHFWRCVGPTLRV
jgi:hypothetical protein